MGLKLKALVKTIVCSGMMTYLVAMVRESSLFLMALCWAALQSLKQWHWQTANLSKRSVLQTVCHIYCYLSRNL